VGRVLSYLSVKNLAVIDHIQLELGPGLTVITGETGTGKSMLLSALTILLGGRVDGDSLRRGESGLTVEGSWSGPAARRAFAEFLDEEEVEDEDEEVAVRRAVSFAHARRRDRIHVGGGLVARKKLRDAAATLLNISSQHEYVSLLKKSEHVHVLDRFARLEDDLVRMAQAWDEFDRLSREVERIVAAAESRAARIAELRTVVEELEAADIHTGEDEELHARISRTTHAVDIVRAVLAAVDGLYEDDRALIPGLGGIERVLSGVSRFEPELRPILKRMSSVRAELEDLVDSLRHLAGRIDAEPHILDRLQERLARLQKLVRKHGVAGADDLRALQDRAAGELEELEERDLSVERLLEERDRACEAAAAAAEVLHRKRRRAATALEKAASRVLCQLEMKKAAFTVVVDYSPDRLGPLGRDRVEFLLSANPGEAPRPLLKIASGGELSRVLLALKATLADAYPVPTYVFDEIDAGIGGRTALSVGRLLAQLARSHQVLCITHTAQIAAFADAHLVVTKEERDGRTFARLLPLTDLERRTQEIARMFSGLEDSDTATSHALELVRLAQTEKRRLL